MDKYEYKLKSEQMLEFMEDGAYNKAAEIADTIDWRRVRNATMLTNVSDIYEKNREYQKSYDILNIAYQRAEGSRKILYRLCVLALKTKNVDEAIDYYDEFVQTAPKDPNRYLLRYQILRARREPIEQQIEALEAFKKGEYIEEWAYELAKLYQEAGMTAECLEECDDLILWFSEGKYVYQAMELKMRYKPLTPSQQEKYNRRYEKSGSTEEIPGIVEYHEERESVGGAKEAEADELAGQPEVESAEVEVKKIGSTMKLDEALRALLHLEPSPDQRDTEDMSGLAERLAEVEGKTEDLSELEGAMAEIEAVSEYDVVEPRRKAPKIDMDPDLEELLPDPEFELEDEIENKNEENELEGIEEEPLALIDAEEVDETKAVDKAGEIGNADKVDEIEKVDKAGETRKADKIDKIEEIKAGEDSGLAISVAEPVEAAVGSGAMGDEKSGLAITVVESVEEAEAVVSMEEAKDYAKKAGSIMSGISVEAEDAKDAVLKAFEAEEAGLGVGAVGSGIASESDEQIDGQLSLEDIMEGFRMSEQGVEDLEKPYVEEVKAESTEVETSKESEAKDADIEGSEKESTGKDGEPKPSKADKKEALQEEEEPILPPDILQLIEEIENGIPAEHEEEPGENLQMKDLGDFEDYDEDADDEFEDELLAGAGVGDEFAEELTEESEESVEERFEEALVEEDVENAFEEELSEEHAEGSEEDVDDTFAEELTQESEELAEEWEEEAWEESSENYVEESGEGLDEEYEEESDEDYEDGYDEESDEDYEDGYDEEFGEDYEDGYDEESDEDYEDGYDEESDEDYEDDYDEESDEDYEDDYDEESDEDYEDGYDEESDEDYEDESWEESEDEYEEEEPEEEEPVERRRAARQKATYDDREVPDDDDKINFLSETTPLSRKETAKLYATGKTAPIPVDEISNALSMSDTGFVVHGRYDLKVQSGIGTRAGLTEDQKKLFSYFVPVRGMSEQLVDVLEQDKNCTTRNGTSATGNLLIIGNKGNGKTVLAVDVVKAIQKQRNIRQGRVAIVSGDSLNKKRISDIFSKLHAGALIIEKAGKMNEKTVARLNKAMEQETGELLVVLEDQRKPLDRLLTSNREFRRKFTSRLEVPIFINDELVTFGQTYAKENGYLIDEMGILALYSRIDEMQREDHPLTIAEVKEVMDQAMEHSQRTSAKKLMRRVLGRGRDSNDRIILGEADF